MDELISKAELREQVGGKGYFANVSIEAEIVDSDRSDISLVFSDSIANEWRDSISVGLRIGWRCLPSKCKHRKHAKVTIHSVDTKPGDSSEVVVMFVAAKAMLSLFESMPSNVPAFVPEFGVFIFPK